MAATVSSLLFPFLFAFSIFWVLFFAPRSVIPPLRKHSKAVAHPEKYRERGRGDALPIFLTLDANSSRFRSHVEHNCEMLTRAGYEFHIHTDSTSAPYCRQCSCKAFKVEECDCPRHPEHRMLCNKLKFLSKSVIQYQEIVFLDADFIILTDTFIPALLARTSAFDFLASYNFAYTDRRDFFNSFNSGLMFWRNLPDVDVTKMVEMVDEHDTCNDQYIVGKFVHKYISRWDTLSLAFHCRALQRFNIPPTRCMGFHGSGDALNRFVSDTNFTFKHV